MRTLFKDLAIGEQFHDGKAGESWLTYEKTTKSRAVCVAVHGEFRTYLIGGVRCLGPFATVWKEQAAA